MASEMKKGQRVTWSYKHWLNSKSFTVITKTGTFLREGSSQRKVDVMSWPERFAIVHFDGNKNSSRVKLNEIKPIVGSKK